MIRAFILRCSLALGYRRQRIKRLTYSQGSLKGHQTARSRRMEKHVRVWGEQVHQGEKA